jgi:hypothetical protein
MIILNVAEYNEEFNNKKSKSSPVTGLGSL